jgi:hypothetical protein
MPMVTKSRPNRTSRTQRGRVSALNCSPKGSWRRPTGSCNFPIVRTFGSASSAPAPAARRAGRGGVASRLIGAVVSRGGRPDLAGRVLTRVRAPTLLIIGDDVQVIELNRAALDYLNSEKQLVVVPLISSKSRGCSTRSAAWPAIGSCAISSRRDDTMATNGARPVMHDGLCSAVPTGSDGTAAANKGNTPNMMRICAKPRNRRQLQSTRRRSKRRQ